MESDDREGKVGGAALCWERWEPAENMHFRVISPRGKGAGYLYTSYHQSLVTDCLPHVKDLVRLLGAAPEMDSPGSSPRPAIVPQGCC